MTTYKLDNPYRVAQHLAHVSKRQKTAVWPASQGPARTLARATLPRGKAVIKALKRARVKLLKEQA